MSEGSPAPSYRLPASEQEIAELPVDDWRFYRGRPIKQLALRCLLNDCLRRKKPVGFTKDDHGMFARRSA